MIKELTPMYMLYDHEGNPIPSSLRHLRRNSIATLEPPEWKLRQAQGWTCEKVTLKIEKINK